MYLLLSSFTLVPYLQLVIQVKLTVGRESEEVIHKSTIYIF